MIDQDVRNRLRDLVTLIDDFDQATDEDNYTDTGIAWDKFNKIREVLKGVLGTVRTGAEVGPKRRPRIPGRSRRPRSLRKRAQSTATSTCPPATSHQI